MTALLCIVPLEVILESSERHQVPARLYLVLVSVQTVPPPSFRSFSLNIRGTKGVEDDAYFFGD